MKINEILKGLKYEVLNGNDEVEVNKIEYDSRKIKKGDLFVCIEGLSVDGHDYAKNAYEKGAIAIICSKPLEHMENCNIIKVSHGRKALATCASNFYNNSCNKLKLVGITGTNGKTTSAFMIKSILESAGYKTGLIGTIANYIGDRKLKSERTTPESLELHQLFNEMIENAMEYCVMEVSSHSLSLDRVYGVEFSQGIFTNLTQDHLDFHKTFENYYEAKLKLLKNSSNSIVNIDDEYGKRMLKDIKKKGCTYSIDGNSDFIAKNVHNHSRGVEFDLIYKNESIHVNLAIPGKYNVYNALCAAGACICEGISLQAIKEGLEKAIVPGRCELATKDYNLKYDVIIDYAHTPDGLENILNTAREFTKGRLISVYGCGGDRDKVKRPIMGKIGSDISDIAIITSDNPRTEEPMEIIKDIVVGIEKENYLVIENRREAIKEAMKIAQENDVIVIAGKGHEDYQVLKDGVIHFDEREVIKDIIKELC